MKDVDKGTETKKMISIKSYNILFEILLYSHRDQTCSKTDKCNVPNETPIPIPSVRECSVITNIINTTYDSFQ